MSEDKIKSEMRLFALESIICQHLATLYVQMPQDVFDAVHKQALDSLQKQTFRGADAAHSDHFSAELEAAVDRLYGMIRHHLDRFRKPQA